MRTLTVHGTSLRAGPTTVTLCSWSARTTSAGSRASACSRHGIAKVSVPVGRYWAIGLFSAEGKSAIRFRAPVSPSGPRAHSPGAARGPDRHQSFPRVPTPRPALMDTVSFTAVLRGPHRAAGALSLTLIGDPGDDLGLMLAPPISRRKPATCRPSPKRSCLTAPRTPAVSVQPGLSRPPDRIPAQEHTVQPSCLAAVTENFFQDQPSAGQWFTFGRHRARVRSGRPDNPGAARAARAAGSVRDG
jgi:hypothetical protein